MSTLNYRVLAVATTTFCSLLLGVSIAGIVTSRRALDIRNMYPPYDRGSSNYNVFPPGQRNYLDENFNFNAATGWLYQALPRHIRYGNEMAVLGCCVTVLALVVFPLVTSAMARVRPTHRSNPSGFPLLNVFLASCSFFVGLVGIIYTQVAIQSTRYNFSRFNSSRAPDNLPVSERTVGDTGTFSLEAWACNAKEVMNKGPGFPYDDMDRTCDFAIASRWLMVPLFVGTALLVVLSIATRKTAMKVLSSSQADKSIALERPESRGGGGGGVAAG